MWLGRMERSGLPRELDYPVLAVGLGLCGRRFRQLFIHLLGRRLIGWCCGTGRGCRVGGIAWTAG